MIRLKKCNKPEVRDNFHKLYYSSNVNRITEDYGWKKTIYLPSDDDALSSSMVREFMHHNIDVHEFVPYPINRLIESGMY